MIEKYNNNQIALILLDYVEGLGIRRKNKILNLVDEPFKLVDNIAYLEKEFVKITGDAIYRSFVSLIKDNAIEKIVNELDKSNVNVVTYVDGTYPKQLSEIYDRPILLYAKGNINLLNERAISVVGTRSPSRYGINVCRDFVSELAQAKLVIISGFARGIDSVAHKMAVELELPTIAVLANGLDVVYPAENRYLAKKILETNGLLISEYKLGTKPATYNFPERNRIISGLADGVFVPEMTVKSGTHITVNHALEQGKNIYVVPGNINSPQSKGTNLLIKSMQGCIVTEPEDILKDYNLDRAKNEKETYQLTIAEQQIMSEVEKGETHFEKFIELTALQVNELNSVLLNLEINGLIEKTNGNFYILK